MSADVVRFAVLKQILNKVRGLLNKAFCVLEGSDARYTSVPLWRPWRDF